MFGREHIAQHLRHSDMRRKELEEDFAPLYGKDTYESCRQVFVKAVSDAEVGGKIPLANEHWFNVFKQDILLGLLRGEIQEPAELGRNPTSLPDDLFDALTPIILIRNPVLAISSMYRDVVKLMKHRPGDEDFDMICTVKAPRLLFDHFKAQGRRVVVVDGEDLLWRTKEMTEGLCSALGGAISPQTLSDKWQPKSKEGIEQMNPLVYAATKDIQNSSGIERPAGKVREYHGAPGCFADNGVI